VVAEYTSTLPVLAIAGYGIFAGARSPFVRCRAAAFLGLGALPMVLLLAWYHSTCFGGILETGYRHLVDVAYQPWHEGGFLGIKTPSARAFAGSFFSPLRGLFALSPLLILGFAGLPLLWRRRTRSSDLSPIVTFTIALCIGYVYFTSSFSYESWGWTTGPRHLTGLVPFLLLPVSFAIGETKSRGLRGIWAGLALSSIIVTSACTFVNYVPDDVSDGVFGLSLPLAIAGFTVPTLMSFFGVPSPLAAQLVFCLVTAVAILVTVLLARASREGGAVAILVLLAFVGAHRLAYRDDDHDRAARSLLRAVWLVPPGVSASFWSTSGHD